MSDYSMADISSLLQSVGRDNGVVAKNSTSRKNNTDLDMTDFLQLMIVQLQSQTMDNSMDTSEMMNQLVQMQMISAITNMTETNIMTYASSLVGKEVTIGIVEGNKLIEKVVTVTGTAMSDGAQVIFGQDKDGNVETYNLSQIMAVGRLPDIEGVEKPGDSTTTDPGATTPGVTDPGTSTTPDPGATTPDTGDKDEDQETKVEEDVVPPAGTGESQGGENNEYDGGQGAPVDGV